MSCACSPACKEISKSADREWPGRSHASDGCCASQAHHAQNPGSDHEPNADGLATAEDITHDLTVHLDTWEEADRLRLLCKAGVEKRVKYIISNRRIASPINAWEWRRYDGVNDHSHHMHISVTRGYEHSTEPWFVGRGSVTPSSQPRQPGVTVPLPPPLVTDYPGENMKRFDVRVGLDGSGNGYADLAGVKARDVVSLVVNAADPAAVNGYPAEGIDVSCCQVAGVTRIVVVDAAARGAVDLACWVATG